MVGIMAVSLVSCKDDDDKLTDLSDGSGTMEQMTPTQSKAFLEQTANEAMAMLNPNDQRDLVELCSYVSDVYGDYELPENFDVEDDRYDERRFANDLSRSATRGDGDGMTRAAVEYIYNIDFDNFKGIYEAFERNKEWKRVGNSNDIVFRFNNYEGEACELKVTGSSEYSEGSFSYTMEDDDYYYSEDERYIVDFKLPTSVSVSLTENGTQLASVKLNSKIDVAGHNFSLDVTVTAANIVATSKVSGTDTKVTESVTTTVGGKNFATSQASATGNHLCDITFYDKYFDDGKDQEMAVSQLFTNGEATVTVIDKVSVDATMTWGIDMWDALACWAEDEREAKSLVSTLNANINAIVRYNNKKTEQARLSWDYTKDKYYGDCDIEPQLVFPDGTTYFVADYFEKGFSSVEDSWYSLTRKYRSVWNSVRK